MSSIFWPRDCRKIKAWSRSCFPCY